VKKELNQYEEKVLITGLMNGDRDAFSTVLTAHREQLIRICRGFVNSREDAEDIAQEVFIQLFRSARSLRGESKLSTWLYRVAVNKSLNYIRSNRSKHKLENRSEDPAVRIESDDSADKDIIRSDHSLALEYALDSLSENQRTAFVLSKYEDLSYDEIKEVMQISLSSVQSLIFRAKKNMQESLREYFENNIL